MPDVRHHGLDLEKLAAERRTLYSGWRLKMDRTVHLLKTYAPSQIAERTFKLIKKRIGIRYAPSRQMKPVERSNSTAFASLFQTHDCRHGISANQLHEGSIELLNQKFELGSPLDWRCNIDPRPSHLWRFQLQYQEYLLDLVKNDPVDSNWKLVWETIDHWIQKNQPQDPSVHEDAWHPYCISRRLPVWMQLMGAHQNQNTTLLNSLFEQADFLSHNLETDLRGNHLLENLKAIAMSACFFKGDRADEWAELALKYFTNELDFQTLNSGEHYERSPMYQCVVLANLLQVAIVAKTCRPKLHLVCLKYAKRMLQFLSVIIHPDGEIPLFSDSCFGEAPTIAQIIDLVELADVELELPTYKTLIAGDYWVFHSQNDHFVFDAGQVAAQGLPGHAHCDLLNFEASIQGQRIFVDSGNYSYGLDDMRQYCRSSVAHNVLTVDGMDHCDIWSKFRMGFRGQTSHFETGEQNGFHWASAQHDAYRRIGVPIIRRTIGCHEDKVWFCFDYVPVSNPHQLQGFLHFSPWLNVARTANDARLSLEIEQTKLHLVFAGADSLQMGQGWYCHEFGQKQAKPAAVYEASTLSSQIVGWYLFMDGINEDQLDVIFPERDADPIITVQYLGQKSLFNLGSQ